MVQTIKTKKPDATSKDFIDYVQSFHNKKISETTACMWLRTLGFSFKGKGNTCLYFDGHERPDVVAARIKYV
jgi:hypothetical protein